MVALVALLNLTEKVSLASTVVSPRIGTKMVLVVSLMAKVRVPVVVVKSLPLVAVPPEVA